MDVSQLHVGGYSSLIFVRPTDEQLFVFWLRKSVSEKEYKLYGSVSASGEVKRVIVEKMNETWGHVAKFSWAEEELKIDLN